MVSVAEGACRRTTHACPTGCPSCLSCQLASAGARRAPCARARVPRRTILSSRMSLESPCRLSGCSPTPPLPHSGARPPPPTLPPVRLFPARRPRRHPFTPFSQAGQRPKRARRLRVDLSDSSRVLRAAPRVLHCPNTSLPLNRPLVLPCRPLASDPKSTTSAAL